MHRFVVQSFEPAPHLDGDRWVSVVCPPDAAPELIEPGVYQAVVGPTVATLRALGERWGVWDGPAFELAFPDDAPPDFVQAQADELWKRFYQAVKKTISLPDGRTIETGGAQMIGVEGPGWVHPTLGDDAAPPKPRKVRGRGKRRAGGKRN